MHRRFTRGLVLGVYDTVSQKTVLNPPVSRKLKSRDSLVMFRPTSVAKNEYKPMPEAVSVDMGQYTSLFFSSFTSSSSFLLLLLPFCMHEYDWLCYCHLGIRDANNRVGVLSQWRLVAQQSPRDTCLCTAIGYVFPE